MVGNTSRRRGQTIARNCKEMARLHQIKVSGFGAFDNEKPKWRIGWFIPDFGEAVRAGLPFNIDVLKQYGILTEQQAEAI